MKKPLFALFAALGLVAFAEDTETSETPAETPAEAPAPKYEKPSYSIALKQYPLLASRNDTDNDSQRSRSSSKTTSYQMKWDASVRVRGTRPEKLELKVFYIAQNAENKLIQVGGTAEHQVELDDKGVWTKELLSPTTTWIETKKQKSRSGFERRENTSNTPEKQGERMKGCVAQLLADGEIVKSFATDPRWRKAAAKADFSASDLDPRNGKSGSR